jgi:hypothetical protein
VAFQRLAANATKSLTIQKNAPPSIFALFFDKNIFFAEKNRKNTENRSSFFLFENKFKTFCQIKVKLK